MTPVPVRVCARDAVFSPHSPVCVKRKSTHTESSTTRQKKAPGDPTSRRLDVLGILLIMAGVLLLLALVSWSRADETIADIGWKGYFQLLTGDHALKERAELTANWLGLFGALLSNFMFLGTVGFTALTVPVLLVLWGWWILRKKDLANLAYYSNYTLILAVLVSAFFGVFRLVTWFPELGPWWSGRVGDFLGGLTASLLGATGGMILVFTLILIVSIVGFNFNIHRAASSVHSGMRRYWGLVAPRRRPMDEAADVEEDILDLPVEEPAPRPAPKKAVPERPAKARIPVIEDEEPSPAPRRTPIAISRHEEELAPAPVTPLREDEDGPRSNGILNRESIDGYPESLLAAKKAPPAPVNPGPVEVRIQKNPALATDPLEAEVEEAEDVDDGVAREEEKKRREALIQANLTGEEINKQLAEARISYQAPTADLLDPKTRTNVVPNEELQAKAELIKDKLALFGIQITSITVTPGPVVTMFELVPDSSVKISKITALSDDLALALAAKGIRIIAPIPGKSAVGIEIPNNTPEFVNFRAVASSQPFQGSKLALPLGLGKIITGEIFCDDLAKMPHLLIAGATGSGKSVGINVMLASLLYRLHPSDVKLVLIDPKKIELAQYKGLSRHFLAVCPDLNEEIITDPSNAVVVLKSLELEMDSRYTKLAKAGVRHVNDYNAKVASGAIKSGDDLLHYKLPYIVVVIDELADLMITAAREIEEPIARLAQLARAVGIHLIVATQRPSVDVITGVIKANFSARIAYQVASRIDSRTILDTPGAERLLGNGDLLYQPSGQPKPLRVQNAFISTQEVERIVEHIAEQTGYNHPYQLPSLREMKRAQARDAASDIDDLAYEAARLVVRHQQGSVSLLQRRLKIGYSRAARIMDQLEIAGVVGSADGSKAREVMVEDEEVLEEMLGNM